MKQGEKKYIVENIPGILAEALLEEQEKAEYKEMIKKVVLEKLCEDNDNLRNQYMNDRRKRDKENNKGGKSQRGFVLAKLRNGSIKQSEAMRYLWHVKQGSKEDDVYRSLFSKCVTGEPDNDGVVRKFTDDEITKLAQYIHDIGA